MRNLSNLERLVEKGGQGGSTKETLILMVSCAMSCPFS